ncbi:MAG: hypothetical protein WCQ99_15210, partial [Pseudomonadota bacterium]
AGVYTIGRNFYNMGGEAGLALATGGFSIPFGASDAFDAYDAYRKRMKQAKLYSKELNQGANADLSTATLSDFGKTEFMTDPAALESFLTVSGVGKEKGADQLYAMTEAANQFKEAINGTGEASALTLGQFQKLDVELEVFNASSVAWEGAAGDVAMAFKKIQENIKALQIKAVVEDLDNGVGVFTTNMQKLVEAGLEGDELLKMQYDQTLKFLTSEAIPALNGELSKARTEFKRTADEMDRMANAEADLSVKTTILRSDMALTEAQLKGLRVGEVQTDMIAFYEAMGWVDKELILVSADAAMAADSWEALQKAADSMIGTLDRLKEQFKDLDVSDAMRKTYTALYQTATAMDILAEAGRKAEALPDVIDAMTDAANNGDLVAFNTQLMQLADTMLYMSGIADALKLKMVAGLLGPVGQVLALFSFGIEVAQGLAHGIGQVFAAAYETPKGKSWIDDFIVKLEKGGLLAQATAKWLTGEVTPAESTSGTITSSGLYNPGMSSGNAVSVYQKYRDQEKYSGMSSGAMQISGIQDEAKAAADALNKMVTDNFIAIAADGKVTEDEMKNHRALMDNTLAAVQLIQAQSAKAIENLKKQWTQNTTDFMQPFETTIRQSGMTDFEKNKDNITQQYQAYQDALTQQRDNGTLYVNGIQATEEQYNQMMQEILTARGIMYVEAEQVEQDRLAAIAEATNQWQQQWIDIVNTAGMDSFERSVYSLQRTLKNAAKEAEKNGYTMGNAIAAYKVQMNELVKNTFDPIIQGIADKIMGLSQSEYNLIAPDKRAAS